MSAQTELAVVPLQETALAVYSTPNGLDPWLDQVRAKVDEFKKVLPDLKTRKGREAYASMAHQIAKSKTALEAVGKEISAKQKEIPKLIDAERKRVWDTLEAWQKEVRKPLDDWQSAEDARVDKHNDGIEAIKALARFEEPPTAAHVAQVIADLELLALDDSWEEFLPEAAQAKDQTLIALRSLLAKRQKEEAEQAELARLRAEAEAREQKDREERIAREAAERARIEAEQKAQAEREATLRREQEAKAAAERRELELKLQAEQAERAAAQAKADQVAAEQRAEQERQAATQRAEQAAEQARIDERRRADAAAAEIVRQQEARERDEAHRRTINRSALEAFVAGGMTEECAKQAITLIAKRQIPNVSIAY
ncbi:TolA protein [Pseudomonas chlororaphis subsp. piscium]|uniref:hypothetical protein n=1 Tax=Pseudomonas chlororaphis TaxID=587753 RepID=UPI000F58748F|nr:hypothetical protein [Pseudomonas chlororaphis]AZC52315.1 TolA protein [Pseudomonas chlororaphis subsp. piscium]